MTKKIKKKWKKRAIGLSAFFYCLFITNVPIFATNKIVEHSIFKGLNKMIQDVLLAIQITSGIAAAVILAWVGLTSLNNSNEQEEKQMSQKVKRILIGLIVALGSSTIINLFLSYVMPTKKVEETAMLLISYLA